MKSCDHNNSDNKDMELCGRGTIAELSILRCHSISSVILSIGSLPMSKFHALFAKIYLYSNFPFFDSTFYFTG